MSHSSSKLHHVQVVIGWGGRLSGWQTTIGRPGIAGVGKSSLLALLNRNKRESFDWVPLEKPKFPLNVVLHTAVRGKFSVGADGGIHVGKEG